MLSFQNVVVRIPQATDERDDGQLCPDRSALPKGDASPSRSYSRSTTSFKVQVKFQIPILEGHIDANIVDKWLNMLEGYFSFHDFYSQENISFALLKVPPIVKDWWEMYCEKKDIFSSPIGVTLHFQVNHLIDLTPRAPIPNGPIYCRPISENEEIK